MRWDFRTATNYLRTTSLVHVKGEEKYLTRIVDISITLCKLELKECLKIARSRQKLFEYKHPHILHSRIMYLSRLLGQTFVRELEAIVREIDSRKVRHGLTTLRSWEGDLESAWSRVPYKGHYFRMLRIMRKANLKPSNVGTTRQELNSFRSKAKIGPPVKKR